MSTQKPLLFQKILCAIMAVILCTTSTGPSYAQSTLMMPQPGTMVHLSQPFQPPALKGIKVYPKDPLRLDFILDPGNKPEANSEPDNESIKLIKYFLASLTIPEKDLWVNLSPFEQDRIIPDEFSQTEMGRDLLSQDYILKQITASVIYPEGPTGQAFWAKVYAEAQKRFGTTDIPIDTFNKVWIVPQKATVYENKDAAFVVESHLKVMLDTDYLATSSQDLPTRGHVVLPSDKAQQNYVSPSSLPTPLPLNANAPQVSTLTPSTQEFTKDILREIIIPILEKEVNEGQNFTQLRQIYHSLILAAWFKKKIQSSLLSKVYVDRKKVSGINTNDPEIAKKIWTQYLQAFKKGVYNYVKEEPDPLTREVIPRKYFSGGVQFTIDQAMTVISDAAALPRNSNDRDQVLSVALRSPEQPAVIALNDAAMQIDKIKKLGVTLVFLGLAGWQAYPYFSTQLPIYQFSFNYRQLPGITEYVKTIKDLSNFPPEGKNPNTQWQDQVRVDLYYYRLNKALAKLLRNNAPIGVFELKTGDTTLLSSRIAIEQHVKSILAPANNKHKNNIVTKLIESGASLSALEQLTKSDSPFKPIADTIIKSLGTNKDWVLKIDQAVNLAISKDMPWPDFYNRIERMIGQGPAQVDNTTVYTFIFTSLTRYMIHSTLNSLGIKDQQLRTEIEENFSEITLIEKIKTPDNGTIRTTDELKHNQILLSKLDDTLPKMRHDIIRKLSTMPQASLPTHYDITWLTASAMESFNKFELEKNFNKAVPAPSSTAKSVPKNLIERKESPLQTYIQLRGLLPQSVTWSDVINDVTKHKAPGTIAWDSIRQIIEEDLLREKRSDAPILTQKIQQLFEELNNDVDGTIATASSTLTLNTVTIAKVRSSLKQQQSELESRSSMIEGSRLAEYAAYHYGDAGDFLLRLHGLKAKEMNFAKMELAAMALKDILKENQLNGTQRLEVEKWIFEEMQRKGIPDTASYADLRQAKGGLITQINSWNESNLIDPSKRSNPKDRAMSSPENTDLTKGGIDLQTDRLNLEINTSGTTLNFNLDPLLLSRMESLPGLSPVIIGIKPLGNLQSFLEIK